jgi:hypothetical protein
MILPSKVPIVEGGFALRPELHFYDKEFSREQEQWVTNMDFLPVSCMRACA